LESVAIQEVMTSDPLALCIDDNQSIFSVLYLLRQDKIRHLPVVDELGQVVGVITQRTLLEAIEPVEMYATLEILRQEAEERTVQLCQLNEQLQQEIAQHQQEIQVRTLLEQQLLEQNAQLQKAMEAAEAASVAKSTFLTNMSHELRTPLHAILGFTQLLQDDTSLSSEHQEHLTIIRHSGEHLLNLINKLLEMSKMEADRLIDSKEEFALFAANEPNSPQSQVFEPSPEALAKLAEQISALPPDWLIDFRQGIIEGDLDWVLALIAQIHECNEPLAMALTFLVNKFQFEELLTLTQKSPH
jgi:signal transduction histidine kinase